MKYTPTNGQDVFDVSLQHFGDIETGLFSIVKDNNLALSSENLFGKNLTLNNDNLGVRKIKDFFSNIKFTINNSDELTFSPIGDFNNDFNNDFY